MIADATVYFKRMMVSTFIETDVLSLTVEALVVAFPLPQLLDLLVEAAIVGPST
jgi:hypothetical protein